MPTPSTEDATSDPVALNMSDESPAAGAGDAAASGRRVPDLAAGTALIRDRLAHLPTGPGVYRMLDADGHVLYVGKARSLRKRVVAYTQGIRLPHRLQRMVAETVDLEVISTHTEVEALLLESNLIKRHLPRFNILLRDDKSFAHLAITKDHAYPQLIKHRGARERSADYYGPFASTGAVNRTITALQRAFMLRNCSDAVFSTRTRPCLQFHIKRCTAPCVARVTPDQYGEQVASARAFLAGKASDIQGTFARHMQDAADRLDFESAARWRDRIRALTAIQAHQDINVEGVVEDADIIAAHQEGGATCVELFFFRAGRNYGNRAYFPAHDKHQTVEEVLAAFIAQFYEDKAAPALVLISHPVAEQDLIAEALAVRAGAKVELAAPKRGDKRRLVEHALANAREALARRMAERSSQAKLLAGVQTLFGLDAPPERIEVFDNSHVQGTNAIGAMIVAGPQGFVKSAYRQFTIKTADAAGDDYAMMREVLTRRFARAQKDDPERDKGLWPDLVLIDGGQGQLSVACAVMAEFGIDDVSIAAIAKGPDRDAGRERFFVPGREPFQLEPRDPVLYYLQRLRDEAHRFAIGTHRARRAKGLVKSQLDEIPGIGPARKKALLHHFGSARSVARAGLADLEAAPGISKAVAKKIYDHFHPDG